MIKGVIFDLDGVLVLTEKYHYSAWKQVLDAENIYIDFQVPGFPFQYLLPFSP